MEGQVTDTRGLHKERVGVVTSNAMQKTITVSVTRPVEHRLYKKAIKRTKKFKAHDKNNECKVGDVVRIRETRPLSKTKRWTLVEIVKRAD
ncbi:MAG TPA: 30S ribosomal protein S17 [Candidatus Hydrogenedentes bacterium]|nr:30S ribosomal protein S17 [Candidatus Hydrogenedentota bacterium]HOT50654.1 30S ribosomal protein S17 [Candidatus Hydrogenedentota bacterium]HOV74518.1 30S ribosomal protein S17 [Candidatus Hydrogenedentota bacterium]HPC18044.1 30S ribosomal protein S17 [Candidatus Hydrogenedentota bacterium]HRT21934.1 30S ribosomal protein S17 [Candidatus Hydrogenedentota bacterium]